MSHRIACYTLFDITKTGVLNRARPADDIVDINQWANQRASQCNLDTIIQIISLRSQPDNATNPIKKSLDLSTKHNFGQEYKSGTAYVWSFDFEVQNASVFHEGDDPLGALLNDCHGVPMVITSHQFKDLQLMLDITIDKRNIYFVKYTHE